MDQLLLLSLTVVIAFFSRFNGVTSACLYPCQNGGTCQNYAENSYCTCSGVYQKPDCNFTSTYLPFGAVAYFPLSFPNSLEVNELGENVTVDKSGNNVKAVVDDKTTYVSGDTLCTTCPVAGSQTLRFFNTRQNAVKISITANQPKSTATTSTLLALIRVTNTPDDRMPFILWHDDKCALEIWIGGAGNLNLDAKKNSENQDLTHIFPNILGNVWHQLAVAFTYQKVTTIVNNVTKFQGKGGMDLYCRPVVGPSTVVLGGNTYIDKPDLGDATKNGIACFGIYNRALSPSEMEQYFAACLYDFQSHAAPMPLTPVDIVAVWNNTRYTSNSSMVAKPFVLIANGTVGITGLIRLPDGTLITSDPWPADLNSPSTTLFKKLAAFLTPTIKLLLEFTDVIEVVNITVTGFRKGSIITDYMVALRSLTSLTEEEIEDKVRLKVGEIAAAGGTESIPGFKVDQIPTESVTIFKAIPDETTTLMPKLPSTPNPPAQSSSSSSTCRNRLLILPLSMLLLSTKI